MKASRTPRLGETVSEREMENESLNISSYKIYPNKKELSHFKLNNTKVSS